MDSVGGQSPGMNPKFKIQSATLQPKQEDEEDGMPTYRVRAIDNTTGHHTTYDMSVEVDGREMEASWVDGMRLSQEMINELFWTLCDSDDPVCVDWRNLHNEQPG
jgi:hypothetical protein